LAANFTHQLSGQRLSLESLATSISQSLEVSRSELVAANPAGNLEMRHSFDEQLRQGITRANANGSPLTLLVIEIDRFGILDDLYGENFRHDVVGNVASILSRNGR